LEEFMKLPHRRQFLRLAAGAAALPALSRIARAQAYPSRPVRVIVSFAAGGPSDILARLIGQWLSERLGQQFVIENRTGAGGNIGAEAVVRAPPDGHTLMLVDATPTISATLYDKLSFNFVRDIAPVAGVARQPQMMLIHPSVPAKTVPEFIAYAKANPGKINMASAGTGTPPHMTGELFKMVAGIDLIHVPYRGTGAAMADLLGGQVQLSFFGPVASIEYIRSGKLLALGVTGTKRLEMLPDIPAVAEHVPGFESFSWFGVGAPRGTPAEIIDRLNKEITGGLADPKVNARIAELGAAVLPLAPAEFGKLIADETEKWAKVVKFAGLKPE
jgi:tripartite-type tricarboxylate transporter receptor subunit TctC